MKVAVIGANGQLGSDLVKVFEDVIPLTRKIWMLLTMRV